jgi:hypothetical protein
MASALDRINDGQTFVGRFRVKSGVTVSFHSAITSLQTWQVAESASRVGNRVMLTEYTALHFMQVKSSPGPVFQVCGITLSMTGMT